MFSNAITFSLKSNNSTIYMEEHFKLHVDSDLAINYRFPLYVITYLSANIV